MKRIWKRASALLMTMAMVLAMVLPVQAATSASLTVDNNDVVTTYEEVTIRDIPQTASNLSFKTYQVLYATYDDTNGFQYHLSTWAASALSDYSESEAIDAIIALGLTMTGDSTTEQADLVDTLAAYIANNPSTDEYSVSWDYEAKDTEATVNLPVGAYLVIPSATNMSFLNMLVSVSATAGDNNTWEITAKGAVLKGSELTIEKTVSDTGTTDTYDSTADAQIGTTLYYEIKVYVPKFAENDSEKVFTVEDIANNLSIDLNSVEIYAYTSNDVKSTDPLVGLNSGGTNASEAQYVASVDLQSNKSTLTIVFSNEIYKYYDRTFYDTTDKSYPYEYVIISYQAELLSSTVTVQDGGGSNTATMTYNYDNHSESKASSTTTVYTYGAVLTKYDDDTTPNELANATFQVSYGSTTLKFVEDSTSTADHKVYRVDDSGSEDITTGTDGTLTIIGLDAGKEYKVVETKAPSGYSLNTNYVTFTITAETDNTSGDLTGNVASTSNGQEYTSGDVPVNSGNTWKVSATGTNEYITMTVTDTTLSALPATGSVGIIVFTIAGVAIMILALVLINSGKSKQKKA